jgi:hypothetical protein
MNQADPAAGARRALVVASQTRGLTGCHNDARLMEAVLRERGFDVHRLERQAAGRAGILGAYEDLIAATGPDDAVVFYYTGHGSRGTTTSAGAPDELRLILPTDIDAGGFQGILAEELSILQWRLTLRTPNVTTILDCCFSSRMSRGPGGTRVRGWEQHWPIAAVTRRWNEAGAQFRRLRADHADAAWPDANPLAVRLVACGSHERAYEGYSIEHGQVHGYLTAALCSALSADPDATWQTVADRVRDRVLAVMPQQRPDGEGPIDRVQFSLDVRGGQPALPVRSVPATGTAWIDGAALHGISVGDEFLLAPAGSAPPLSAPIGRVTSVTAGAAQLEDITGQPIPPGVAAHTWRRAADDLSVPIAVEGGAPEPLIAALSRLPGIRTRIGPGKSHADQQIAEVATVAVTERGVLLRDPSGNALYETERPADPRVLLELRRHLQDLAVSLRLRGVSNGTLGADALATTVTLVVSAAAGPGDPPAMPVHDGDCLHVGDRLWIAVASTGAGAATVYANVLDLGVAGRISVLNQAEPAGITLDAGERRAIGEQPGGNAPGLPLRWPPGVPTTVERHETVLAIFADIPQDLRGLTREGVRTRGGGPLGATLLARLMRSGSRDLYQPTGAARYTIQRVTFVLCPGGIACTHRSPDAEP